MEEAIVVLASGLALVGWAATVGWQRVGEARRRIGTLEAALSRERAWGVGRTLVDAARPTVAGMLRLLGRGQAG